MTRLLIVDDNPQSLYLLQVLLSANGFELDLASNGAEALEQARRALPDMIISDVLMPVMDGFALCRACKQDERLKDIPFVFYAATYTDPKDEEFALSLGAERFIVKPLEPAKFLALLREIIETHKAGKLVAPCEPIAEEAEYYKQYNAALIRKLENKVMQLEEANRALELDITGRKRAEAALQETEARYRALVEQIPAIAYTDSAEQIGQTLYISPQLKTMVGYDPEAWITDNDFWLKIMLPEDRERVSAEYTHSNETGEPFNVEYRVVTPDGRIVWFRDEAVLKRDPSGHPLFWQGVMLDITERKQAEAHIRQLNRVYAVLSEINQAIVRVRELPALFEQACCIAVETGGFRMAWVGLVDESSQLQVAAQASGDDAYFEQASITLRDASVNDCPIQNALRGGQRVICNVIKRDALCQEAAFQLGSRSSAAFPLLISSKIRGTVNFYSDEPGFFDEEEVKLLDELALDLSFALEFAEKEADRKRAEEALRRMNERFALATRAARLGVWDWDIQKNELVWDDRMYELYGVAKHDFGAAYEAWLQGVHPDDRAFSDQVSEQARRGERDYDTEFRVVWPDGSVHHIKAYGEFVRDASGAPLRMTGINYDITERKRADEALRESEERYRQLVELSPDAVVVHSEGKIVFVNPAGVKLLRARDSSDIVGKPALEFVHPDYRQLAADRIRQAVLEGTIAPTIEEKFIALDGAIIDVEVTAIPFRHAGKPAMQVVVHDITKRKRAEERLAYQAHLLANVHDAIIAIDKRLDVTAWNRAAEEMYGRKAEEVLGRNVIGVLGSESAEARLAALLRTLNETGRSRAEGIHHRKDGQPIHVEGTFTALYGADGQITGYIIVNRDITERKRSEAALQKSQQLLERTFAGLLDAIFIIDADTVEIIDCNPAASEMFGYSRQEMLGRTTTFLHIDEVALEEFRGLLYPAVEEKGFLFLPEFRMKRKDGAVFPTEHSVMPIEDEQGQRIGWVSVVRDITARKRAEAEIQRHVRYLATLHEIDQALTSTLDLDQVLSTLLEQVQRATDAEAASVALVEPPSRLAPVEGGGRPGGLVFRQAVGEAGQDVIGLRLQPGQGIAGWVAQHQQSVLVPDAAADPRFYAEVDHRTGFTTRELVCVPLIVRNAVTGVIELVNKRQGHYGEDEVQLLESVAAQAAIAMENARLFEAERAGRQRLEMLYRIGQAINSTLDAGAILDRLTDEAIRATHATHGSALIALPDLNCFERRSLRGYSPEQAEKARSVPLPLNWGVNGRAYQTQRIVYLSDVQTDPDYFPLIPETRSELVVPILRGGQVLGNLDLQSPEVDAFREVDLGFLQALTDQVAIALENARLFEALEKERASLARRVEERTAELNLANAELRQAARAKDEFLASMSHELRTPLNAILGLAEALQEQVFGSLNEKQLGYLHTIEESGQHLLALINDILDLSKVEASKVELQLGPVVVESVCQAGLQFIKQTALKKQIKVSSTLDSQVGTLQADERRLKQILVNLLGNAVKFTPEGGSVGLDVVGDVERQRVHFVVWDTGIGIAPEDIGRLFQPFVQLDSSLSRQYPGTGLGLSLVKRLVELHGGNVSVESDGVPGKGSRFTVSLPWKETSRQVESRQVDKDTASLVSLSTPSLSTCTVLLAEDDETTLAAVSDYLSAKGYRVIVARNGQEVIQRAREDKPDAIIMDVQMPGMDGLKAIRRIRADPTPGMATIPIIVLTAMAMPGDRERCLEAGANDYVSKPASLKELIEAIEAQLH
jgi:PAS domain S-box-containing protein